MVKNKKYRIRYTFVDYEQTELQRRLNDVFDSLFDEEELTNIDNDGYDGHDSDIASVAVQNKAVINDKL